MQLNKDNNSFEILKFIFVSRAREYQSGIVVPHSYTAYQYAAGFTHLYTIDF